jgi:uncharacterized membrane protein YhaH (DUF805 family)
MFEALKKYNVFRGRAGRREYWLFVLLYIVASAAAMVVDFTLFHRHPVVQMILCLGLLIPGLAVGFRRLHDIDRTAWWLLIGLIPFLGAVVLLIFHLLPGTPGPNRYGASPGVVDDWPPAQPAAA